MAAYCPQYAHKFCDSVPNASPWSWKERPALGFSMPQISRTQRSPRPRVTCWSLQKHRRVRTSGVQQDLRLTSLDPLGLERNKRGCNKRGCKSKKCGNMQSLPNLREIGRICAKFARNLRKFAKSFLQILRKVARNLRPRLLRYRLFLSDASEGLPGGASSAVLA